jgi:hypothetical protein
MQEAQKQTRTVVRVDVAFRNAFNAMSQAALWAVMEELNIPDVDLLKALYANATVRLKPDGGESNDDVNGATITFDTGVAQVPTSFSDLHEHLATTAVGERAKDGHFTRLRRCRPVQ